MLIGIPPILGPEMLFTLRSMGHGDEIALVEGNYPALEHARRLLRADGHDILPLMVAILQVLPLDALSRQAIVRSGLNNDAGQSGPFHHTVDATVARLAPGFAVTPLDGAEFYPRVRAAHTVVATTESTLFANVILRKGVILPDDFL